MAGTVTPHFQNDRGARRIMIGAKEFMCVGASPPFDHPHVFIDMGDADEAICPYCSTLYGFSARLTGGESDPPGCAYDASSAAA